MRKDPVPFDRPAPEELDAIRRRFPDVGGARADGAASLADLAEALGVPAEAVQAELDRLRESRAVRPAPRRDQRALLGFAIFLLASAGVIHRLNPRPLSAEEQIAQSEEIVAELRARRRTHPVVHYPILRTVETGAMPPPGFSIAFEGVLTKTTIAAREAGDLVVRADSLRAGLVEAVLNAYQAARDAERAAPPPKTPLSAANRYYNGMPGPDPNSLVYSLRNGGYVGRLPIDAPVGVSPADHEAEVRRQIAATVDGLLDGMARSQEASLKIDPFRKGDFVMPPAGYGMRFEGMQSSMVSTRSFVLVPYDAERVARKLEWAVRSAVWRDASPSESMTPAMRSAMAKRAGSPFATVTLSGPRSEISFRLPMAASAQYPTAADAVRAADRILAEACREAAAQVREGARS